MLFKTFTSVLALHQRAIVGAVVAHMVFNTLAFLLALAVLGVVHAP